MDHDKGSQLAYRCRLEWGYDGAQRAAARQDILVVVDTLRFSTTTVVAVAHGAIVLPETGSSVQLHHAQWESLSPGSYECVTPGARVPLRSLNGATCCRYGETAPYLFVASLINARAAAQAIAAVLDGAEQGVSVIACGERRSLVAADGPLRFAIEDYLGAGALLSYLDLPKSAEARVCQAAFEGSCDALPALLRESTSGWELRHKGLEDDVQYAAQLNALEAVPVLKNGELRAFPLAQ